MLSSRRLQVARSAVQGRRGSGEERLFAALATITSQRARRAYLSRHPRLVSDEVVARLSASVPQKLRVDVEQAVALAEAAAAGGAGPGGGGQGQRALWPQRARRGGAAPR